MRPSRLLVIPVVAAVLAIPTPASAGTGSTSSGNGVLYDVCRGHGWTAEVDPDENDWRLDITVVDPSGGTFATEVSTGDTDDSVGILGQWTFCGTEQAGTYTIHSTLTEYLPNGDVASTTGFADDTFRMRKPRSRTVLKVSDATPHYNEIVRFRATSKKERPGGYVRAPYARTKLQFKTPRGWQTLRLSKATASGKGVTVWRYRWNTTRTYRVRAVTVRSSGYTGSHSGLKRVDQVAGGRVLARPAAGVTGVVR
jgi:hypothetical protein